MFISSTIVALAMASAAPSASTLAAVKVFAVNVDRQWPPDDSRGQAVTGEALRLMAAAARGIADDWKVDHGKLRESIAAFESAREALSKHPRGDRRRPELARDALDDGRLMIDRLAAALKCDTLTTEDRAALKKSVEEFDQDQPVRQQVDDLERYFRQAAALLQSMIDAAAAPKPLSDAP